jgi:ElaB/YqjD/DUF883 family membrane-anchored ribosome-binding protein
LPTARLCARRAAAHAILDRAPRFSTHHTATSIDHRRARRMLLHREHIRSVSIALARRIIMNKNGMTGTEDNSVDEKLDSIKDSVKGYVERGAQKADAIKNKVVEVKDEAMHRGSDMLDRLASLVRTHPLKAVGIAFGIGYIGMRLFRR